MSDRSTEYTQHRHWTRRIRELEKKLGNSVLQDTDAHAATADELERLYWHAQQEYEWQQDQEQSAGRAKQQREVLQTVLKQIFPQTAGLLATPEQGEAADTPLAQRRQAQERQWDGQYAADSRDAADSPWFMRHERQAKVNIMHLFRLGVGALMRVQEQKQTHCGE